jgi:hypothetical protein
MLVPTAAVSTQIAVLPAICRLVYSVGEFSWFRFWDAIVPTLGRVSQEDYPFGATSQAQ